MRARSQVARLLDLVAWPDPLLRRFWFWKSSKCFQNMYFQYFFNFKLQRNSCFSLLSLSHTRLNNMLHLCFHCSILRTSEHWKVEALHYVWSSHAMFNTTEIRYSTFPWRSFKLLKKYTDNLCIVTRCFCVFSTEMCLELFVCSTELCFGKKLDCNLLSQLLAVVT